MYLKQFFLVSALVCSAAAGTHFVTVGSAQEGGVKPIKAADVEYQTGATLWVQKAAEYRALAYQAFNAARWQLDADLDKKNAKKLPKEMRKKPRAIMVDIDETTLDNSPSQAYGIKNRVAFDLPLWYRWGDMRKAKAVPGSVDFLNYAVSKGVKVYFVSNRDEVQKEATMDNLKSVGFRDVTPENVLLRQNGVSTKEPRREYILKNYRIVMFIGDNLDDHSNVFEKRSIADRFAEVDKAKEMFGTRYIVLPNPMYGTWENAIYGYGRLSEAEKSEKRAAALELP